VFPVIGLESVSKFARNFQELAVVVFGVSFLRRAQLLAGGVDANEYVDDVRQLTGNFYGLNSV